MTVEELRSKRAELVQNMSALDNNIGDNSPTDEQRAQWDAYKKDIADMDEKIKFAQEREELQRQKAKAEAERRDQERKANEQRKGAKHTKTPEERLENQFSIVRAMRSAIQGKSLDGAEAEAYQEAQREARGFGKDVEGTVALPSFLMEKRDQVVGTDGAGGFGVFQEYAGHFESLQPRPIVEAAGATVLRGLTSNVRFTKNNAVSASWEGEQDANAEVATTFSVLDMSPNRVGAKTHISKQLMVQSSPDVENIVRRELRLAIQNAVDQKAINGDGTGNTPTGILNTAGIGDVAIGTNGGAATWAHIVDLESEISVDNADIGRMAYITTPGARGALKTTEKASSTAQFIWNDTILPLNGEAMPVGQMNGYRAMVSTNVPNDLTKGTGTALNAVLFGHFPALYLANWGGLDIVVDPYHLADTATVRIVVNSWWDVGLRYAEHFAAIQDFDLTA